MSPFAPLPLPARRPRAALCAVPLAVLTACTSTPADTDTGGWTWTPDDTAADTDTDTETDTEDSAIVVDVGTTHCGIIEANEVWRAADNPHVITCDVEVENATLTWEPGVQVLFADRTPMYFSRRGGQAGLIAEGTAEAPIVVAASDGGGYGKIGGLYFTRYSGEVRLEHVEIRSAGKGPNDASLWAEDIEVHARDLYVHEGVNTGVVFVGDARFSDTSENVRIEDILGWPLEIAASQVHTIPIVGSTYDGNNDAVRVNIAPINRSVRWNDPGIPYVVVGDLVVDGIAEAPAVLTLGEGVEVLFGVERELRIAPDGAAGLVTEGTAAAPVRLGAWGSTSTGYWGGVLVFTAALDDQLSLRNTIIERAGANDGKASVYVERTPLFVEDVVLRDGVEHGFRLIGTSAFAEGSSGLTVHSHKVAGELPAGSADTLPPDSDFTGNFLDYIDLNNGFAITRSMTWPLTGVPYRVVQSLQIGSTVTDGHTWLTLPPGSEVHVAEALSLGFSRTTALSQGYAGLHAVGTESDPIRILSSGARTQGQWAGLIFEKCLDGDILLDHVELGYGGGPLAGGTDMLHFQGACSTAEISNAWLHHSGRYALRATMTAPLGENVTFNNNFCGDIGTTLSTCAEAL